MATLPEELRDEFINAAKIGDIQKINELVNRTLEINKEVADYIRELSDNFEIGKIRELFNKKL